MSQGSNTPFKYMPPVTDSSRSHFLMFQQPFNSSSCPSWGPNLSHENLGDTLGSKFKRCGLLGDFSVVLMSLEFIQRTGHLSDTLI